MVALLASPMHSSSLDWPVRYNHGLAIQQAIIRAGMMEDVAVFVALGTGEGGLSELDELDRE